MPGTDLNFDGRDLPAAASHSAGVLPFCCNLLKLPAIAIELGFLSGQRLPPLHDHIDVFGIQFHAAADPLRQFRGREGCAAAQEGLVYQFSAFQVIENRAPHQFDRLLRGVIVLFFPGSC